jgi:hypothetical protein
MLVEVSERNNGMTSMDEVFNLLDVTNSVCPSKQAVQKFFLGNEKHLEANRLLSSAQYTFEDVVNFLQRMKFNFSLIKVEAGNSVNSADKKKAEYPSLYKMYQATIEIHGHQSSMLTQ